MSMMASSPEDELKRFMALWKKTYGGESKNGLPGMIGGNIKDVKVLTPNTKDMDYPNLARMSLEDFCAYFGTPKVLLNYSEGINRANADAEERFYWNNTIKPLHRIIADQITRKLLDRVKELGVYFEFDYADIPAMQKDQKAQADTAKVYFDMGCSPANIFKFLNIDIDLTEGQDVGRYPFNLTVAGEEKDSADTSAETETQTGQEMDSGTDQGNKGTKRENSKPA